MSAKAIRCLVEIDVKAVTSPGTWLPKHEDVYLSVSLFGQDRRTRAVGCAFPLHFHDVLRFDKIFHTANQSSQAVDVLEGCTVRINLIQCSEMFSDGRLLACFESNARNFLYPYPSRSNTYTARDRELLLERTLAFPGISPRMEFSTKTVIEDNVATTNGEMLEVDQPTTYPQDVNYYYGNGSVRRSRSRVRSPTRSPTRTPTYGRATVSSSYRYRSPSPIPTLSNQMKYLGFYDGYSGYDPLDNRPPFVVRKVERDLIERRPSSVRSYYPSEDGYGYGYQRYTPSVTMARYGLDSSRFYRPSSPTYLRSYETSRLCSSNLDDRLNRYSDPYYGMDYSYRQRSGSPSRYLTKLRDRYDVQFDDRYWSPHRSSHHHSRDRGLRRNRSLERVNTFHGYSVMTAPDL